MTIVRSFLLSIALGFASILHAADPLDGLDAAIAKGMKAHGVPGLGVAIVKDGKVVLAKGYGVREVGKTDPVTEKSLFAIGSVSKSFTATAIGMLVEDGHVRWSDSINKHVKEFVLHDAYLTQESTIRDGLCHRIGLDRNEFIWYGSPFGRDEIIKKLRQIEPKAKFRTTMMYNNMVYMALGQIIPQVGDKKSWDDFVKERIFTPLKMDSANTSTKQFKDHADIAHPHEKIKGKVSPVDWRNLDNCGPAGSINASAAELAEYIKFHLSKGKVNGKQLLKKETLDELHRIQISMAEPPFSFNPESLSRGYAMGWMVSDFKGKRIVEHGGNIDGMTAQVAMMPDEKLGIVLLANHGQSILPMALMFDIFDRYTGEPNPDRAATTGLLDFLNSVGMEKLSEPDEKSKQKDTKPSHTLRKYAGRYQDKKHAEATVRFDNDELTAKFNSFDFTMTHWHFDTFLLKDRKNKLPGILASFVLNKDGKVEEIWIEMGGTIKLPRIGDLKEPDAKEKK